MKEIFKSDFLDVQYHEKDSLFHIQWLTPPNGEEFRQGISTVYAEYAKIVPERFLIDLRQTGVIPPEDQEWASKLWMKSKDPIVKIKSAFIVSEDFLTNVSVEDIINEIKKFDTAGINKYYSDEIEARLWLFSDQD